MSRQRKPVSVRKLAGIYELVPTNPKAATGLLLDLYGALARLFRDHLKKTLAEIERDYSAGRRYFKTSTLDRLLKR